ncbi:amidase family protein, partial [Pseudorhodobacter sp.]|uniref:amidase family protein n=1 Tax=Pseudorhodobacter sp. TaxID=1934400 RepID=UPI002648A9B0
CDTTFTGEAIDPECAAAARDAAKLLESMGHHVSPGLPRANILGMMRAWTDIVAIGTALSIHKSLKNRDLSNDLVEGVGRGAVAHAATLSPTRYLEAVNEIHAFGREMAAVFDGVTAPDILLSATLAELPAKVGRFSHTTEDYVNFRIGPGGVFAYSPYTAVFNASGQPAASVPLGQSASGLPIGVHLAARFGADDDLIALCADLERAAPWGQRHPSLWAGIS